MRPPLRGLQRRARGGLGFAGSPVGFFALLRGEIGGLRLLGGHLIGLFEPGDFLGAPALRADQRKFGF